MEILGAIDSSISLAKQLYELIENFREAPENARAHLLNSQLSNIRLDLLRTLVKQTEFSLDDVQKGRVAVAVGDLVEDLRNAIMYLQNRAPNDLVSRMQWAVWTGKGVTKLFDDIESRFSVLQSLFDLARQHPNLANLDKDHFTIISDYPDYKYLPCVVGASYCVEADLIAPDKSNLNRARPRMDVFVESYLTTSKPENESNKKEYKEARKSAQFVAERLWWTRVSGNAPYQTGVLPCIGYAEYRVVFLLPSNLEADLKDFKPQTLRDCIMTNTRASLETRFSLALQLAEAVFKLHLAGLAHRSIRSNLILFLRPKQETSNEAKEDAPRGAPASRNPEEEPPAGLARRLTRRFTSKKDKPAPGKSLRRNPSLTSMKDKLNVLHRIGARLGRGASEDRDLDLLDKATADQEQGATPSSRSRRPLSNSVVTPRSGKIPPGFGSLYLTGWTSAHHAGSNHNPRTLKRARDIYMHPALRKKTASWRGGNDSGVERCVVVVLLLGERKSLPTTYGTKYWHWLVWKVGAQATRVDIPPHGLLHGS